MNSKPVGSTGGGGGGGGGEDYILIRDEKPSGTVGGTFAAAAWQTRTLNAIVSDSGGHASLSSNQITLAAGTYRVEGAGSAYSVGTHKCKLRNITDGADIVIGSSEFSHTGIYAATISVLDGKFTIAVPKILELQHRCNVSKSSIGFGVPSNFGVIEIYSNIKFWKEL